MKPELILLLERFPDYKEQIKLLFECDEEFQALCSDYFLCIRSVNHWELTLKKYQEHFEGYLELKRVLENKLLHQAKQDNRKGIDYLDSEISDPDNGSKLR
jgi:hypothetical protein